MYLERSLETIPPPIRPPPPKKYRSPPQVVCPGAGLCSVGEPLLWPVWPVFITIRVNKMLSRTEELLAKMVSQRNRSGQANP